MKAYLLFEDGTEFRGQSFGSTEESFGEVVFNTGLTGYQEILTDPSYCGQIINMTYPLIGNYGANRDDFESIQPYVQGFVARDYTELPSNWRSTKSLGDLLKSFNIPALYDVDTRSLTKKIRQYGTMKGCIYFDETKRKQNLERLKDHLPTNQVEQVSTKTEQHFPGTSYRIVLMDYGCKRSIIKELLRRKAEVILLPYNTSLEKVMAYEPDGILLSNGPGDPRDIKEVLPFIKEVTQKIPTMGICLGHQLISLAYGAEVTKLKFGHRGSNHPVKNLDTGKVCMSSQNHSYAIIESSLKNSDLEVSHISMNDKSIEGLKHTSLPLFSIQFHPEASPGPTDNEYLFDQFFEMIEKNKNGGEYASK